MIFLFRLSASILFSSLLVISQIELPGSEITENSPIESFAPSYAYATWTDMTPVIKTNPNILYNVMSDSNDASIPISIMGASGVYVHADKSLKFFSGWATDRFMNMSFVSLSLSPLDPNLIDYQLNPWFVTDFTHKESFSSKITPRVYAVTQVLLNPDVNKYFFFLYGGDKLSISSTGDVLSTTILNTIHIMDLESFTWQDIIEENSYKLPSRYI